MKDIKIVSGYQYIDEVKKLILLYIAELNRNLDFQAIDDELDHLDQKYQEPDGKLLVAVDEHQQVVGCVAFYRFDKTRCEMKRLFVLPAYRKMNIGQLLVENIIEYARFAGYQEMILDTVQPLKSAISLYQKYGFQIIDAYYHNPMDDVIYMRKIL